MFLLRNQAAAEVEAARAVALVQGLDPAAEVVQARARVADLNPEAS